jgi:UDP-N-acetylglucosamine 2-epimerase (non-hydrolysing)
MVLTDSGGLQEETTALGIPCMTLRHNTERPITCDEGSNIIVGNKKEAIVETANNILQGKPRVYHVPEKWDGNAAVRIVEWLILKGN